MGPSASPISGWVDGKLRPWGYGPVPRQYLICFRCRRTRVQGFDHHLEGPLERERERDQDFGEWRGKEESHKEIIFMNSLRTEIGRENRFWKGMERYKEEDGANEREANMKGEGRRRRHVSVRLVRVRGRGEGGSEWAMQANTYILDMRSCERVCLGPIGRTATQKR